MAEIIGVKFKPGGKLYYFQPNDEYLLQGTYVIVETARGIECGEVVMERRTIPDEQISHELKKVIRGATAADLKRVEDNHAKEKSAFEICEQKIANHKLDMKLVNVEYAFDGSKILFNFTADGRVDFRELVKDLASVFHTRIELRQIGVRDVAKSCGGLGICGRPFCCSTFLGDFVSVSIKMAKEQGLSLNPVKISGTCGRLMCCLKYEEEAYKDLIKHTPKVGMHVNTPDGPGTVVEVNLINGNLRIVADTPDAVPKTYNKKQVSPIGGTEGLSDSEAALFSSYEEPVEPTAEELRLADMLDDRAMTSAPVRNERSQQRDRGGNRPGSQRGGNGDGDDRPNRDNRQNQNQQNRQQQGQQRGGNGNNNQRQSGGQKQGGGNQNRSQNQQNGGNNQNRQQGQNQQNRQQRGGNGGNNNQRQGGGNQNRPQNQQKKPNQQGQNRQQGQQNQQRGNGANGGNPQNNNGGHNNSGNRNRNNRQGGGNRQGGQHGNGGNNPRPNNPQNQPPRGGNDSGAASKGE